MAAVSCVFVISRIFPTVRPRIEFSSATAMYKSSFFHITAHIGLLTHNSFLAPFYYLLPFAFILLFAIAAFIIVIAWYNCRFLRCKCRACVCVGILFSGFSFSFPAVVVLHAFFVTAKPKIEKRAFKLFTQKV